MEYPQMATYQNIAIVLSSIATLAAAVAAFMAWLTADKTHKNTQAQIMISLLDDYGSSEMRKALQGLPQRWDQYGAEYIRFC